MDEHESGRPDRARRQFLMAARGAGAFGAIAVLFGKAAAAQATPVVLPSEPAEVAAPGSGYRETEHIRKYYRSVRNW